MASGRKVGIVRQADNWVVNLQVASTLRMNGGIQVDTLMRCVQRPRLQSCSVHGVSPPPRHLLLLSPTVLHFPHRGTASPQQLTHAIALPFTNHDKVVAGGTLAFALADVL